MPVVLCMPGLRLAVSDRSVTQSSLNMTRVKFQAFKESILGGPKFKAFHGLES